jgi:hypothetical protein
MLELEPKALILSYEGSRSVEIATTEIYTHLGLEVENRTWLTGLQLLQPKLL